MHICFVFVHNTTAVGVTLVTVPRDVLIEFTQLLRVLPPSDVLCNYEEHSRWYGRC